MTQSSVSDEAARPAMGHVRAPTQDTTALADSELLGHLQSSGRQHDAAVAELHGLMVRAARQQVTRSAAAAWLGAARRDEIVHSAADEATMAVLAKLHTFEGRSRFTTWAYKFAILHAVAETRRAAWRGREVALTDGVDPADDTPDSAHARLEGGEMARAIERALREALTPHQRMVATALLINQVPIDVLAERLGSNRNALYKTVHEVRLRLRAHLAAAGHLELSAMKGVSR